MYLFLKTGVTRAIHLLYNIYFLILAVQEGDGANKLFMFCQSVMHPCCFKFTTWMDFDAKMSDSSKHVLSFVVCAWCVRWMALPLIYLWCFFLIHLVGAFVCDPHYKTSDQMHIKACETEKKDKMYSSSQKIQVDWTYLFFNLLLLDQFPSCQLSECPQPFMLRCSLSVTLFSLYRFWGEGILICLVDPVIATTHFSIENYLPFMISVQQNKNES